MDVKVLRPLVRTSRASWKRVCALMSICFSRKEASAPSRAPVNIAKATIARSRRSMVVRSA